MLMLVLVLKDSQGLISSHCHCPWRLDPCPCLVDRTTELEFGGLMV